MDVALKSELTDWDAVVTVPILVLMDVALKYFNVCLPVGAIGTARYL